MASQEKLWTLYHLQQLGVELAGLERRRAGLDDGAALGREVVAWRQRIAGLEEEQRRAAVAVREAEMELASTEERIRRIDQLLYSGKVANPKELQGYEGELASLRRRKDSLEEQVLFRMEERDAVAAELATARQSEEAATARWKAHVRAYRKEIAALDAQKQAIQEQQERLRAEADPDLLRLFDSAMRQRKAFAACVEQDACGACGMVLPGRLVKEYKTNPTAELQCPTCGAHLLWTPPPDAP